MKRLCSQSVSAKTAKTKTKAECKCAGVNMRGIVLEGFRKTDSEA